jgi:putative membrane protein
MHDNSSQKEPAAGLDAGTRLSFERTYLAHERTQMAWVRTSLALITFGFSIAKFYQFLEQKKLGEPVPVLHPRTVGLLMIAIGLVSLGLGSLQHALALRALRAQCPDLPRSLAGITAGLLALLGVVALFGAFVRQ